MKKLAMLCAAATLALGAGGLRAQPTYPDRTVRLVVPASAGGTTDVLARAIAQQLSTAWSQPVIVDNRPGANQIIGAEAVAKAAPDGYTLLVSDSSTFAINPHLYRKLPYDPIRDFTPVAPIGSASPVIAVATKVEARNLGELLAQARAHPGMLSYGSMGTGSYSHIAVEHLKRMSGADFLHVPYKGAAPAISDLLANNVSMMLVNIAGLIQHQKAGKVRFIATTTPKRLQQFPDIPTAAESGLHGFEANTWFGIVGPTGMDPAMVDRINAAVGRIIRSPEFRNQVLQANTVEPMVQTPREFGELIRSDLARWKELVAASGASLD